ncbi:hypothetical protein AVEN_52465-1 [Araneus ventricosus]|uniref:Uncharacterized protein n=1 Tax=Araneus ventricosus TaxID=182803 RepID=A0A4Y2CY20_ARAVE|nr:hypothetical protein AVEN_52465-1 [Araneus ventricosus]
MSIFGGEKKFDLKILAEELGEKVDDSHKLKDLKKMILASKEYDENCAKDCLNTIKNERKEIEEWNSFCLLRISIAHIFKLKPELAVNELYGFGNQRLPAMSSIGRIEADIEVYNVKGKDIRIYIAPDDAQSVVLIIGRGRLELLRITYTRIRKRIHIGYREDEPFRNFPIDEK